MDERSDLSLRPILVIEDCDEDFDTILEAARRSGVTNRIVHAAETDDAWRILHPNGPPEAFAFVILDQNLPGMNGEDFLLELRSESAYRTLPVVLFSTSNNSRDRDACYSAGANAYHVKSIRFEDSIKTLDTVFKYWLKTTLLPEPPVGKSLMEGSTDCVKVLDLDGRIRHMNAPGLLHMEIDDFGRICGREWPSLWPESSREQVRTSIERGRAGETSSFQAFRPTSKGTPKWWDVMVSPVREADGGPVVRLLSVARDITAAKQAEQVIHESRERLRIAVLAAQLATWDWDLAADRITWSDELALRQGLTSDQAPKRGADFKALVHPDDLIHVQEQLDASLTSGCRYEAEFRMLRADGTQRWVLAMAEISRDTDGRPVQMMGVELDISARKQAEEALRRREAELQSITNNVPDIIARFDRELRHVFVNAAVTRATGLPPEAFLGRTNRELWMPPALCDRWEKAILKTFKTGQPNEMAFSFDSPDGERRYDARIVPEIGPDGRIEHALAISRDVTTAWRAAKELARAKDAAEAASAAKDRFLAVLSHELRTPLTPVRMAVSMWERRKEALPAEFQHDLAMIRRNVDLECRLIDDMLDLNRIASGKLELQFARVDLHAEIRHAVQSVDGDADARRIVLSFDAGARRAEVIADAARLQQVLWNLLKNAVKFTPPGGAAAVRTSSVGDKVRVEVTDTGAGIDGDAITRIFNAFEQGGAEVTRQFGGLGLGLAISKALVDMHGGKLSAHSDGKGLGATFTLDLDLAPPAEATADARGAGGISPVSLSEPAVTRTLRILLVEDHDDTARLIKRVLATVGYDVQIASCVADAVAASEAALFDLVISDLGLPDGSGHDLIRQLLLRRPTKAIALSGYGMEEDIKRGADAGFAAYLVKPVNLEQLVVTIQRVTGVGSTVARRENKFVRKQS